MELLDQKYFLDPNTSIDDDLNLNCSRTIVPNVPKEIIFPDELNRYLKDQIQYLAHENGMLKKNLEKSEIEIKQSKTQLQNLTMKMEKYEYNIDCTPLGNVASTKIVELSKKLREKSSELEVYKTKCSKLEYNIQFQEKNIEKNNAIKVAAEKPVNVLETEVKSLGDRIHYLKIKLVETRNSNSQLKNDLKIANKFLVQEVGDSFENIQLHVAANPNWRGRSQIITDLQQKNSDLREKLKRYDKSPSVADNVNQTKAMYEKRMDVLNRENNALRIDLQDLKKKLDGARARCKVLDTDCAVFKSKINTINDQSERDRDLISSLTAQISNSQNSQNESMKNRDNLIERLQKNIKEIKMDLHKEKCRCEHLEKVITEKDFEINMLSNSRPSTPRISQTPKTEDKTLLRFEAERLRFLELSQLSHERLIKEREARANIELLYRRERHRAAKLEGKIARLALDQSSDKSSSYSYNSTKVHRETDTHLEDKLELAEENIKALETRLQIEKREREVDMQEFSRILKSCSYLTEE